MLFRSQSEAASGKPLAHYWLHNGMVKVGGEKMSKSLGNFTTIRDLLARVEPMAVRLFVLQAHYRKPLDFTDEALFAATQGWQTLKEGLLFASRYGQQLGWKETASNSFVGGKENIKNSFTQRFQEAVDNDFNFAEGLAVLFEIAKELRKEGNLIVHQGKTETPSQQLEEHWNTLLELSQVLGLEVEILAAKKPSSSGLSEAEIEHLIEQRVAARKAKNYAEGDRIREQLKAQGILLIDQVGGTTVWQPEEL